MPALRGNEELAPVVVGDGLAAAICFRASLGRIGVTVGFARAGAGAGAGTGVAGAGADAAAGVGLSFGFGGADFSTAATLSTLFSARLFAAERGLPVDMLAFALSLVPSSCLITGIGVDFTAGPLGAMSLGSSGAISTIDALVADWLRDDSEPS